MNASARNWAKELVSKMTLEQKASLCSGKNFWFTKAVEEHGVPSVMYTDGPHGLRKQAMTGDHLGINESVKSTCFPAAVTTSSSFDRDLLHEMGVAIGEEAVAEEVAVVLGPAANIKRSPLCGRNFEYISEDPYVTGELATALINGIQSKNVGTSMKHYLVNNQEKARMVSNSVVDERALREIYLPGFETAVKNAQPWTLMCSYNQINGTYASDNKRFMTDIPRGEWGFEGAIVTDWGAMHDRVLAIKAGLDLEMPASGGVTDMEIVEAVRAGELDEALVDICAARVAAIALAASENEPKPYDIQQHNELARRIARESAVLLKNDGSLPASKDAKVALIGAFAKTPRYQGAGSSRIVPHFITSSADAFEKNNLAFTYSEGYSLQSDEPDETLISEAVKAANDADIVFVYVGLPDSYESEGFDRTHLELPPSHNRLVDALIETGKKVVAVILAGGVINLPWRDRVSAILLLNLTGQNNGDAAYDLLFGDYSPCGKLAETWPLALSDTPCYGHFGTSGNIEYRESIYVGYRYYDKAAKQVAYPFGYGLSYSSFEYSDIRLSAPSITDTSTLTVTVTVKNTGDRKAKEIVQLYVKPPKSKVFKPEKELRGFEKLELNPGEQKEITFTLCSRAFSYYNVTAAAWHVVPGSYEIMIGASSVDMRLNASVEITPTEAAAQQIEEPDYNTSAPFYYTLVSESTDGSAPVEQFEQLLGHAVPPQREPRPYTTDSTLGEVKDNPIGKVFYERAVEGVKTLMPTEGDQSFALMITAMLEDMPLRGFGMMSQGQMSKNDIQALVEKMNQL